MSFSKVPTDWIANWSSDGTDITIPIATLAELTAAEAHTTTGDIRDIVFAFVEHFWDQYNAKASADRPAKMKVSKTAVYNATYDKLTSRYMFTIETNIGTQEVRDEYSNTPSSTPSSTPSGTPSSTPSGTPSSTPSSTPSGTPSSTPSGTPSSTPSSTPSGTPSSTPSSTPSHSPS